MKKKKRRCKFEGMAQQMMTTKADEKTLHKIISQMVPLAHLRPGFPPPPRTGGVEDPYGAVFPGAACPPTPLD